MNSVLLAKVSDFFSSSFFLGGGGGGKSGCPKFMVAKKQKVNTNNNENVF